jgi:hypothetical protein
MKLVDLVFEVTDCSRGAGAVEALDFGRDPLNTLSYNDSGLHQNIMVTRLKENLYCSNSASPPKTFIIEDDKSLTVVNSDAAMIARCSSQATKQISRKP